MKTQVKPFSIILTCITLVFFIANNSFSALDLNPPSNTRKLIFIHHSCGENWLADDDGGLGAALGNNNYFVSDTNYSWGPDNIGDRTDIGNWWEWFQGPTSSACLDALYSESRNNSGDRYTRPLSDPGGENTIILFKSCYPNSNLRGNTNDAPAGSANALRGQDAYSDAHNISNAKGIYRDLLNFFISRPDKMFVAITAPPLSEGEAENENLPNARAFNNWLVNDWLHDYTGNNVFVFDFYNVLTSNGGSIHTNDSGKSKGNHHRIWDGAFQHVQNLQKNDSAYALSDSHPSSAGNQKATDEFIPLLNAWYNCWQNGGNCPDEVDEPDDGDPPTENPIPLITANGQDNNISVEEDDLVTVSVSMHAGTMTGATLDWWMVYFTSDNKIYSFTLETGWEQGVAPVGALPLMSFEFIPVFASNLEPGTYSFYFGVDSVPDEIPAAPIWLDSVTVTVNESQTDPANDNTEKLMPAHLVYKGAFGFPESTDDEWNYSGHALAYYPGGNPEGSEDAYPGSLYAACHAHQDYVGEFSIPAPVNASSVADLPRAEVMQAPADITGGWKDNCTHSPGCMYREVDGLAYLPGINKIAWNLRDWYNVTEDNDQDSLGWSNLDMTNAQGVWHIGTRNDEIFHNGKTCNYLFKAPESFADKYLNGKWLIAGNHREGGALGGSQGPALFALSPWMDGNPPAPSQNLNAIALVYYPENYDCVWENSSVCAFPGYRAADSWGGGAWVSSSSGSAVLIMGRKGLGESCYGEAGECGNDTCATDRGFHAFPYEAQMLFYDTADIIAVRNGTKNPWQVLPYHVSSLSSTFFNQECAMIGAAAWDSERKLLYVTETEINDPENGIWGATAVHVWQVR